MRLRLGAAGAWGRLSGVVVRPLNFTVRRPILVQIRPGDLVAVETDGGSVHFAVLTKQILFGGHWCFVFYDRMAERPSRTQEVAHMGFNAFVDFIQPKRAGRVTTVSRTNDFSYLSGPELLQQQPLKGQVNYRIWRWKDKQRQEVEYVRFTDSPTDTERCAPEYSCLRADFACELATRKWKVGTSMWAA
jgi:hypothetical protein